jgi:23S rRNA-/tRNA-specific pseudouridylate synthase
MKSVDGNKYNTEAEDRILIKPNGGEAEIPNISKYITRIDIFVRTNAMFRELNEWLGTQKDKDKINLYNNKKDYDLQTNNTLPLDYKPDIMQPKVAIVPQNIDSNWTVYDILNEDAAIEYGKGTYWWTASINSENNDYKDYTKDVIKLYIGVNKRLNRKVQWDYKSGFIKDELNNKLICTDEIESIFRIIVALNPNPNATLEVLYDDKSVAVMNKEGEYIIEPGLYDYIHDMGEYWEVRLIDDNSVALIDKGSGEYIIEPGLYDYIHDMGEYWEVRLLDNKRSAAIIDKKTGEYIIEPGLYDYIYDRGEYWEVYPLNNSDNDSDSVKIDKVTGEVVKESQDYHNLRIRPRLNEENMEN